MNPRLPDILKPHPGCLSEAELFQYVEGKLSADAIRRAEEHFSDCEFCSDALDGIMENGIERSKTTITSIRKEIQEKTGKAKSADLTIAAGAVTAHFALLFLLFTIVHALSLAVPSWAAALIVASALAILAALLLRAGLRRFKQIQPVPERTVETLKENVEWAKQQAK